MINQFNLKQTNFCQKVIELNEKIVNFDKNEEINENEYSNEKFNDEILDQNISKIEKLGKDLNNLEDNLEFIICPPDIISFVANKFNENNLLKFLFDLTLNDLRDITILDAQSKEIANKIIDYKKLFKKPKKEIKYNFENELINFYDEEIKLMISDYKIQLEESQDFNEENATNYILEKISKTLPQELISFLNNYRKKNKNIINKINQFYTKSIHSNFETYLNKTSQSINVIYTFTPIVRANKFNFEIRNETFGEINCENLKNIYINLIRTERQLELDITDFYDSDSKLLLIHFEENDAQNLEFVTMFLTRFEKEKELNNLEAKIIIILIHLSRKKEEYNKDIFIPSLSELEQTFIDNLFGRDILISDIMEQNILDIYNQNILVNIDELFRNELYYCFQKIKYSFQDKSIDQNEYINKIINKILDDTELMTKIKNRIIKEI